MIADDVRAIAAGLRPEPRRAPPAGVDAELFRRVEHLADGLPARAGFNEMTERTRAVLSWVYPDTPAEGGLVEMMRQIAAFIGIVEGDEFYLTDAFWRVVVAGYRRLIAQAGA